jgi:plasmid stabilization system protein ParE
MTWAVAWRPLAERDFTECTAHIAQDNADAALRFVEAVEETVASLAENPMLSTATHELVRILPGERDLPEALVGTKPEPSTPEH